jgi:hypothetical protein
LFFDVPQSYEKEEVSTKSKSKADEHGSQPHLKQNSFLHRHLMWLHPWVSSTIAWHPGHLRHCLDWNGWVSASFLGRAQNRIPWPIQLQVGRSGIAHPWVRIGIARSSYLDHERQARSGRILVRCGLLLCHIALQDTQTHWKQAGH